MKRLIQLLLFVALFVFTASGCGPKPTPTQVPTLAPTEHPTAVPTRAPTATPTEAPTAAPTKRPTATPTERPTATATAEPAPEGPPSDASLGDTWVRSADGMVMVYVPAGEFVMGSDDPFYNNERPPHTVALDGFWIDQTEVTNSQYQGCVKAGVCKPPEQTGSFTRGTYYGDSAYDDYPVIHANWYRAVSYCNWVGARLSTEEQWEYVARGPDSRWFPWGNAPDGTRLNFCDVNCALSHADSTSDDGYVDTAPVGSYPTGTSWCGALDMLGNVWEWVWDWYGYYPSEENPDWLSSDQVYRVIRGGAWDTEQGHARGTFRNFFNPAKSHDSIGFRCVVPQPGEQLKAQPIAQLTETVQDTQETRVRESSIPGIAAELQGLTIDDFFEESYKQLLLRSPEVLTALGIAESFGLRNDRLDSISDAYVRETQELEITILDMLRTYDRAELIPEQQISFDVYEWYLDSLVRGHQFTYHDYPLHHFISSYQFNLDQLFTEYHLLNNRQDVEDYVVRLSQVDDQVEQLMEGLTLREEAGVVPPRFIVELSRRDIVQYLQMRSPDVAAIKGELLPVYTVFREAIEKLDHLNAKEKQIFLDSALLEIEESFIPAYVRLLDYLDHLQTIATNDAGVWKLPNGDDYYAYLLHRETSTDLSATEIHEIGLAEVDRIEKEMREVFAELGYPPGESLSASINRAIDDGGYYDISTQSGKDRFIAATEALIEEADQRIEMAFDLRPSAKVVVVGGRMGGYYVSGTPDGSRPGAYHVSVSGNWRPKYYMPTAAFHETVPGHHFQIAIAQESDLPLFRNDIVLNGYAEGWALYAERLAWELGLYDDDPYGNVGRLQLELLRAVRLVADTGIHAMGWSREEARAYMIDTVGDAWSHEVERYVVLPAQATGYKIGMLKILELRQMAMEQLGDQFDLKEFHRVVLSNGSMPLSILERVVLEYIDEKLGS